MRITSNRLTPAVFLRIAFLCSRATIAYLQGLSVGNSWLETIGETPTHFLILMCAQHSLDQSAFIRGFLTGYHYHAALVHAEEAERENWRTHRFLVRWHNGEYTNRYPLQLPVLAACFILASIAALCTHTLLSVFFMTGLGVVTLLIVNAINFILCIRKERQA